MIGRHFLIYSKQHITVKRQYTICNSIQPQLYKALLEVCDKKLASDQIDFDQSLLKTGDTDSIYVTAKDYHTKRGVVTQLNRESGVGDWFVKGPMGMGLQIDKNAHNIAFAGGTGILVFLDLVAQLVLLLVDQAKKTKLAASFGPQFKFTLYFTAPNEAEAIGVELCRKLQ